MRSLLLLAGLPLLGQYLPPQVLARVRIGGLDESSGIAPSRRHKGSYWTHNDSGSRLDVYLISRKGTLEGSVRLAGVRPRDVEGVAVTPDGHIYIGDIGDNQRRRKSIAIYRVEEPVRLGGQVNATTFRLTYPDAPHDCEALLVHPASGDLYLVTKARGKDTETVVYRARAPLKPDQRLERVAVLRFPNESALTLIAGRITGGDTSPDGRRVILCDYFQGWEYVLPAGADFTAIWGQTPKRVDLGRRLQGEAVCYRLDGRAIISSSEGSPFELWEAVRR